MSGNRKISILEALKKDHQEIRAELDRAMMEPGAVGEAAARLAKLCVPHFELEERNVFPALELLHDFTSGNEWVPEVADRLDQVHRFNREHKFFGKEHQAIISAVDALLAVVDKEGRGDIAEMAYMLKRHEKVEDELDLSAYGLSSLAKTRI